MSRALVPGFFVLAAISGGIRAVEATTAFTHHPTTRFALLAVYATVRMLVSVAFAVFIVGRSEPHRRSRQPLALMACMLATAAVLLVASPNHASAPAVVLVGDVIAVCGCLCVLIAVLALGRCFGILPEARGLVTRGPYRLVRHPVYLGEITALAGLALAAPVLRNVVIFAVFLGAQLVRMRFEERALMEAFPHYAAYAARTNRLLPMPRLAHRRLSARRVSVGARVGGTMTLVALVLFASAMSSLGAIHHARHKHHHRNRKPSGGMAAPRLISPTDGASVESMPTFEWSAVSKAHAYQVQISADPRFGSVVQTGITRGSISTFDTAVAVDRAMPDGVYYWRVRAVSAKDATGPWSGARRITKAWTATPRLNGPDGITVSWPTQPVVFSWSQVPYATAYSLTVATDPALANQVIGSAKKPLEMQGTVYTPGAPLTPGTKYFWAVTPLDAQGHPGKRSAIASFTYAWPTETTPTITDLNSDPRVFDPQFSWVAVPGAARYEVEVNAAEDFPAGSKWCCSGTTIGTAMAPTKVLANNRYYWRVRAIDASGNAGIWNYGQPFSKTFDEVTPTIPNLHMVDPEGHPLGEEVPATSVPIATWDPVPGASSYEVQWAPYEKPGGCEWAAVKRYKLEAQTATTAWTPLGTASESLEHIGPTAWPIVQHFGRRTGPGEYCLQVLARTDDDAFAHQVVSDWTQINGVDKPAFKYEPQPPTGTPAEPLVTPGEDYILPASGTITPRTPLFTWKPVAGARGYYVIIARDSEFTKVADIGFTNVPAYAPELFNSEPLADETTVYYWAVIPCAKEAGGGVSDVVPQDDSPREFNKSSVPPTALAPVGGTVVSTQPTFSWTPVENARNYRLQVAADPSFGNPIEDVTTDATAFTSSSTYPANTVLYWRVRGNDWIGQGLNWSAPQRFVRTLPAPAPSPGNATGGEPIPALTWSSVQGAVGYEVHVAQVDGVNKDFTLSAPAFTPTSWYGVGVWRWQVRALFPTATGAATVTSGYSEPVEFVRTLNPPSGARGVKSGGRIVISWDPDPAAKAYEVQVSTSDGFERMLDSHRTDNTSWAPSIDFSRPANNGRLYWRVAAIDSGGNVGSFAGGSFGKPVAIHGCKATVRLIKGRRVKLRSCAKKKRGKRRRHH